MAVGANENISKIPPSYLFRDIGNKVLEFTKNNPDKAANLIRLGIGDATLPLASCIVEAGKALLDEMSTEEGFAGYVDEAGISDVRQAVSETIYNGKVAADHIFISTGSKEDSGSIGDVFSTDTPVYVTDPVYPVYVNTNIMYGRSNIRLMECNAENNFMPAIPESTESSLIWLCNPNNPTGQTMTTAELTAWIDYANKTGSIILYDAAYKSYIRDPELTTNIFDIDGAQDCVIEFQSFSKSHSFTGVRVAWVAFGDGVKIINSKGEESKVRDIWNGRQAYRTNGVSRPLQAMALKALSEEGMKSSREQTDYYLENAKIIREGFTKLGMDYIGGDNSPYIWVKTPKGMSSWEWFDYLLENCAVVCTPGAGFGGCGEGYFRLSAFGKKENVIEAMNRISGLSL